MHKREVQTLQLKDGTFVINNPEWTIKEKAVLDAKRDAGKWAAYPTLALLSSGGLGTATFFICEDDLKMRDESSLISATIVGSLGMVGSYNLFGRLDKKNTEGTSADDIELYKETYSKEFEKRKFKNIIISTGILGLMAGIGLVLVLKSIGDGMSNYDACFDPRC